MSFWHTNNYQYYFVGTSYRFGNSNEEYNDIDSWMDYHNGRNRTSHTYNLVTADEVYVVAIKFLPDVKILYKVLEEKND